MPHSALPWTIRRGNHWPFSAYLRSSSGQSILESLPAHWSTEDKSAEEADARPENTQWLEDLEYALSACNDYERLKAENERMRAALTETQRIVGDIVLNADWGRSTPRLTQEQCEAIGDLGWQIKAALETPQVSGGEGL